MSMALRPFPSHFQATLYQPTMTTLHQAASPWGQAPVAPIVSFRAVMDETLAEEIGQNDMKALTQRDQQIALLMQSSPSNANPMDEDLSVDYAVALALQLEEESLFHSEVSTNFQGEVDKQDREFDSDDEEVEEGITEYEEPQLRHVRSKQSNSKSSKIVSTLKRSQIQPPIIPQVHQESEVDLSGIEDLFFEAQEAFIDVVEEMAFFE